MIALDTETVRGRAVLIGFATKRRSGCLPVSSWSQIAGLLETFRESEAWLFNLDYDVRAMLAYLPREILSRIQRRETVRLGNVSIDYLPGKCLELRFRPFTMFFWDAWQFYEKSLESASRSIGRRGKLQLKKRSLLALERMRSGSPSYERVKRYCARDAQETYALAAFLKSSFSAAGVRVNRYYSAGNIAKRMLREYHSCPNVSDRPEVLRSYYGNRVECMKRGSFPVAYYYDIRSAYPYALSIAPDLCLASFVSLRKPYPGALCSLIDCSVTTRPGAIQPLPVRTRQGNVYPRLVSFRGTWSSVELETAQELGLIESLEIHGALSLIGVYHPIFAPLVKRLYARKQARGADYLAIKKILNSLYGITAEQLKSYGRRVPDDGGRDYRNATLERFSETSGTANHPLECLCLSCQYFRRVRRLVSRPREVKHKSIIAGVAYGQTKNPGSYYNPFYAGYLTATTRAKILRAACQDPDAIIAIATDAIISERPLKLDTRERLGAWEALKIKRLVFVGNGIYTYEHNGETITHFRGVESKIDLRSALRGTAGTLPVKTRRAIGIVAALNTGKELNIMETREHRIDLEDLRRLWRERIRGSELLKRSYSSEPLTFPLTSAPGGLELSVSSGDEASAKSASGKLRSGS